MALTSAGRDGPEPRPHTRTGDWWVENVLRPVLIAGMMVCLAAPLVGLLEWYQPAWDGSHVLPFAFLAALEGILSERVLQRKRTTGWSYAGSRAAELIVLLLALKVAGALRPGLDGLLTQIVRLPAHPDEFLTLGDLLSAAFLAPLWLGAVAVSRRAQELDAEPEPPEPPPDRGSAEYYLWLTSPPQARERQSALNWLGEAFLWGGMGLTAALAAAAGLRPSMPLPPLPLLLYLALGLALLAQARYAVLDAGWRTQRIIVQPGLGRRWLVWGLGFFLAVALLALLLPTRYALGPWRSLIGLLLIVGGVLTYLLALLLFLVSLPLAMLFPNLEPVARPELPQISPMAPSVPGSAGVPGWLEVVGSLLFWLLIAATVGYAVWRFVRDRLGAGEEEASPGGWRARLMQWWRGLFARWRAWRRGVQARLAARAGEQVPGGRADTALPRFFSLRSLSPRQLVRYFYLSALRRAEQAGYRRGAGQTPYEYRAELGQRLPDLEPDLGGLTEAFVEARYSRRPVAKGEAAAVKPLWQRIKAALRRRGSAGA